MITGSHAAEGSLMPFLVMALVLSFVPPSTPFLARPIANAVVDGVKAKYYGPGAGRIIELVEDRLVEVGPAGYFAGGDELTSAG